MIRNATVQIAGQLSYRERLEAFWRKNPAGTQREARKATGAPKATVQHVHTKLVASGRLVKAAKSLRADPLRAV